jgi:hypothetical protein
MRSTEQRARRAEQERERRAAESPACRQARLASDKASTRRRRQALTLESDITAKRRNSARLARLASDKAATRIHGQALESSIAENQHMRAEHRRQAAVVAEARCARRDATHNDAFEHLVWLHSCSGSLGVMNARRLSHLKNAGASAALEIARQDVLADVQQHISLSTLDMARCVSDFSDVNNVDNDMKVCGSCGTRDPDDPYPREVTAAHMVNTMNFRVYELGSMNFRVLAHSPRPPPGEQLNVPQPGFSPLYYITNRSPIQMRYLVR